MKIEKYSDFDMMAIEVAQRIAGDLTVALHNADRAMLAVPGGTTPGPIFDDLCAADLDWSRVDVVLTDERWVPGDHPRSNTRLVRERLLVNRAASARMVPLYAETPEPEESLAGLMEAIEADLPIAVAVLGMGADMHTASLFPDSPYIAAALDAHAPILLPVRPESQPEARITLSARALNGALAKHVVFKGQDKMDALQKARTLPHVEAPIAAVLDGATVHWTE
ncbi:6-phosphogluconolactonase [Cognatishimia sp. D5M38]|uniref:6-phosphogluconolactonase n=1 Tax=Cognatishimia coralii TaxID=3083254 RepID=A0ABU8QCP7_9RHOB